jgi:hypothetical protein
MQFHHSKRGVLAHGEAMHRPTDLIQLHMPASTATSVCLQALACQSRPWKTSTMYAQDVPGTPDSLRPVGLPLLRR